MVPAYWLALLVIGTTVGSSTMHGAGDTLVNVFFLQIYSSRTLWSSPIMPAWTICVEVTFYAFLAIWAISCRRLLGTGRRSLSLELPLLGLLAVFGFCWRLLVVQHGGIHDDFQPLLVALPASFDAFAAGMALALVSVGWSDRSTTFLDWAASHAGICWAGAATMYGFMCWLIAYDGPIAADWADRALIEGALKVVVAVLLVIPAVGLGSQGRLVAPFLRLRPVVWVGVVSYGLYLWHVAVLDQVKDWFGLSSQLGLGGFILASAAAYLTTLGIAWLSWTVLERRAIGWAHRLPVGRGSASVRAGAGDV